MRLLRPYTVVGYMDLWEIHPVHEHIHGFHADDAAARLRTQLRATHDEYREVIETEGRDALIVIAVFKNYLFDMGRRNDRQTGFTRLYPLRPIHPTRDGSVRTSKTVSPRLCSSRCKRRNNYGRFRSCG